MNPQVSRAGGVVGAPPAGATLADGRGEAAGGGAGSRVNESGAQEPGAGVVEPRPPARCRCPGCRAHDATRASEQAATRAAQRRAALRVVSVTAAVCGTTADVLLSRARDRDAAAARQLAMYVCHERLHLSSLAIGRVFGRDHSSVLRAVRIALDWQRDSLVARARLAEIDDLLDDFDGSRFHHVPPHLPFAPLAAFVTDETLHRCPDAWVVRAYYRAREVGEMSAAAADSLAVRLLGVHPVTVWGDAWLGEQVAS